jgi:hypothetical protein
MKKNWMLSAVGILISSFIVSVALAAIPSGLVILQKTADNNGSGVYVIEDEVQFPNGQDNLVLKETWYVEGDSAMKLYVTGGRDLKDQVQMSFTYANGMKYAAGNQSKLGADFIEKYFHIRRGEAFANDLIRMKIVPAAILNRRIPKTTKDIEHVNEGYIRLARVGGVVSYAFGTPSAPDNSELSPGFWIEQDQFVLRKFRLPDEVEVSADKYSSYARNFWYPRTRTVHWGPNQVTIQTLSVQGRTKETFAKALPKSVFKLDGLNGQPAQALVQEFYQRFR